jgi:hypothetical protein
MSTLLEPICPDLTGLLGRPNLGGIEVVLNTLTPAASGPRREHGPEVTWSDEGPRILAQNGPAWAPYDGGSRLMEDRAECTRHPALSLQPFE